jgi:acyl-CoA synthetase (AMP-forming)/AMP-acid ligase II
MDLLPWTFQDCNSLDDTPLILDSTNPKSSLSYSEVCHAIKELIGGLKYAGLCPGDCVMVSGFNDIYYPVLYFGIIGAGGIFTGVNPSYTSMELLHHMRLTRPKFLIVEPNLLDNTPKAVKEIGLNTAHVYAFDHTTKVEYPGIESWTELLNHGQQQWVTVGEPGQTVAQFASTSGTFGLPKAARIPHTYHIQQVELMSSQDDVPYQIRRFMALPPFHAFATTIIPASIRKRVPVYIMRRFETEKFSHCIQRYKISETYLPPPIIMELP